jgi:hypothetical protein
MSIASAADTDEGGATSEKNIRLEKIAASIIDPGGLVMPSGRYGRTFNGTSFQQDGLVTHDGWQYATWYNADRRVCVGRRKLPGGDWQRIVFEDYKVHTNDAHNVPALGICGGDGTIHLSWDHHCSPLRYRRSRPGVASRPEAIEWSADLFGPVRGHLLIKQRVNSVTYPRFLKAPEGRLQFIYRVGGSGNGDWHLADYDPAKGDWTADAVFISRRGVYEGSSSRCAYLNDPRYDDRGRLILSFCWRETSNPVSNHDLNFALSEDRGVTWKGNEGEPIGRRGKTPLSVATAGLRVWEIPTGRALINSTTTAVDSAGRVHVVTYHMPEAESRDTNWRRSLAKRRYFHYWRDAGGKWYRRQMGFTGSRPKLWMDGRDNAFLVFNAGGKLTIAAALAAGQWADWQVVHTEDGAVVGEPLVDAYRGDGMLSIYVQQVPEKSDQTAAPLRVVDLRPIQTRAPASDPR